MAKTIERLEATAQLDRALSALGEGLAVSQDIAAAETSVGTDGIAATLAKCVQNVFNLKQVGLIDPASPTHIKAAMSHLRQSLSLLQNATTEKRGVEEMTRIVAQCLAILYPVSILVDQLRRIPGERDGSLAPKRCADRRVSSPAPDAARPRERRSSIRQVVEVDIGVHSGTNFFTGFSEDISSGGLFVSTYEVLPLGAKVNVNFSLPYGPILSVNGTVRWLRDLNKCTPEAVPGMGVQFDTLTEEEVELINEYMADTPPLFFE